MRRLRRLLRPPETQIERLIRERDEARTPPDRADEPEEPRVRPAEWQSLAAAETAALSDTELVFFALVEGALIVRSRDGDGPIDDLVEALAGQIERPYRARAVRREGNRWWLGANPVELVELPRARRRDFTLTIEGRERLVDGRPVEDLDVYRPIEDRVGTAGGKGDLVVQATYLRGTTYALTVLPAARL